MNIILSYTAGHCVPFIFTQLHETMWLLAGSCADVTGDSRVLFIDHLSKNMGKESLNGHQQLQIWTVTVYLQV